MKYLSMLSISIILFILVGCASSQEIVAQAVRATQAAWTPLPTYTPQPTIEVTRVVVKVVTATPTATPKYTPTPSATPTQTPTPTQPIHATQTAEARILAELMAPREDGFYLVNFDMAPGTWRSQGNGDSCYWARTDRNQEILDNHFGLAGGVVTLRSSDFQFETQDCGTWVYLGQ